MAGLPELNGVFGTFGGMSGLDLTPLQMKQRQRMFQQTLAQEAQKMAQQGQLATRGLDLQERGQDLGTQENELARKFAENLTNMRQQFETTESEKQRTAATAAQQRAIQEAQRSQGSAQDFQGQQAAAGRTFQRGENELDRALKAESLSFDKDRFEKTFGLQSAQFDFTKEITLKDQGRQDRADELKQQMFELQKQEFTSQAEQRAAQTKLVTMQVELYGEQLADAREEADLTDEEMTNIIESAGSGDVSQLDASVLKKLSANKKSREAVFGLMELVKSSQEIGLVKKAMEKQDAPPPEEATATDLTQDEVNLLGSFRRKAKAQGMLDTDVGQSAPAEVGIAALEAIRGLKGEAGEEADALRANLREVAALIRKITSGAIGGLFDDTTDRSGRLAIEGLSEEEMDRLDELIASLKGNGIELVD